MVSQTLNAVVCATPFDAGVAVGNEGSFKEDMRFHEDVVVDDSVTEVGCKDFTLLGMADDETGG